MHNGMGIAYKIFVFEDIKEERPLGKLTNRRENIIDMDFK
jgi:hypothetical protein